MKPDSAMPQTPVTTVRVVLHCLLKTIAVVMGLAMLGLGGLALMASINLPPPPGPAQEAAAARVIVMGLTLGMLSFGAFLVWKGMKPLRRQAAAKPAAPGTFVTDTCVGSAPTDLPEFGRFIARCGPQQSGLAHYYVYAAALLATGLAGFFAPIFIATQPGEEALARNIFWIGGGVCSILGMVLLWKPLCGQNQVIFLYERGLVERRGTINYQIPLEAIEHLCVKEWHEHRFAPRTYQVRAKVRGQRELAFSSALKGESMRIIEYLTEHVEKTEMVPFQA
jgi:hypothetical protein